MYLVESLQSLSTSTDVISNPRQHKSLWRTVICTNLHVPCLLFLQRNWPKFILRILFFCKSATAYHIPYHLGFLNSYFFSLLRPPTKCRCLLVFKIRIADFFRIRSTTFSAQTKGRRRQALGSRVDIVPIIMPITVDETLSTTQHSHTTTLVIPAPSSPLCCVVYRADSVGYDGKKCKSTVRTYVRTMLVITLLNF